MTEDDSEQQEEQPRKNREDEEVRELLSRIQALEAAGRQDEQLTAELSRRGVSGAVLKNAWQQHIEDFPEHGHQQDQIEEFFSDHMSLEDRLGGPDGEREQGKGNPLYDVASRLEQGENVAQDDLYNALEQAETYISQRGGLTDNEYQALNNIQEQTQQSGYISNEAVDSIKKMGRLQIGDSYLQNDNRFNQ